MSKNNNRDSEERFLVENKKLKQRIKNLQSELRKIRSQLKTLQSAWSKTESFLRDVTRGRELVDVLKSVAEERPLPLEDSVYCEKCNSINVTITEMINKGIKSYRCKDCSHVEIRTEEEVDEEEEG